MLWTRAWHKLALRRKRAGFHSRFGGFWTDRLDAPELLELRLARGALTEDEARALGGWIEDGFWIERGAVPVETIERVRHDLEEAWRTLDPRARVEIDGRVLSLAPELRTQRPKLLDQYVHSRAALEAAFAAPIRRFLSLVFERDLLLFQGLSFEQGSEQAVHQDAAYVVASPPLEFAAAWIALEDVQEGSGELVYYPGSHRLEEFLFRGGYRNWNREHHGLEAQERYHEQLLAQAHARGLRPELFRPRQGDVLFWSADLAHGGAPIRDRVRTRRSLVCHYCPGDARPYYFTYRRDRRTRRTHLPGCSYASSHHDLRPA